MHILSHFVFFCVIFLFYIILFIYKLWACLFCFYCIGMPFDKAFRTLGASFIRSCFHKQRALDCQRIFAGRKGTFPQESWRIPRESNAAYQQKDRQDSVKCWWKQLLRQRRIILSADTASESCQLLGKKRRQYFVYWRAFLQSRWQLAAVGAVLKPLGGNCAVLP